MIASLITTYARPDALRRSLPQIAALGWPTLVVEDGSDTAGGIAARFGAAHLRLPENRGLAAAMNAGLAYWLADKDVQWVSYFQDDVDLASDFAERIRAAMRHGFQLITGHDAMEHPAIGTTGSGWKLKTNARATHLMATRDYWLGVMPIPTRKLGAPCREPGERRGTGSEVDHWITHRAPASVVKQGGQVLCIPGLVRTFLWRAADSCWDNEQAAGEDPAFGPPAAPAEVPLAASPKLKGVAYVDFWRDKMARGEGEAGHCGQDLERQADAFWEAMRPVFDCTGAARRVLEIGSGWGRMLRRARALFPLAKLCGLELSAAAARGGWHDDATTIEIGTAVPVPLKMYDVVYTCTCLQHVTDDAVLAELARGAEENLHVGGRIVLLENVSRPGVEHVRDMSADDYRRLFRRISWDRETPMVEWKGQKHAVMGGWRV